MPIFCTQMQVYDHINKQLVWVDGKRIEAPTWELAEEYIITEGYNWLVITGKLICEIPCKKGSNDPDWKNKIDYEKIQQN